MGQVPPGFKGTASGHFYLAAGLFLIPSEEFDLLRTSMSQKISIDYFREVITPLSKIDFR